GWHKVDTNSDRKMPWRIYKPWMFPTDAWYVGFRQSGIEVWPREIIFNVAVLGQLERLPLINKVSLPGRLDVEILVPSTDPAPGRLAANGRRPPRTVAPGVTYTKALSNLFGFYVGWYHRFHGLCGTVAADQSCKGANYWRGGADIKFPNHILPVT